eukprot:GEMP01039533.1.p1 GENE.GEMP01039533.1~~GEMP01039533.1.p1  ORF type:complete len:242 (+),score=42.55 GEMP01039533.1:450-1175(+)
MIEEDIDTTIKVIIVGNGEVGKTSMITRFARGVFTNDYKKTLAVDFLEKKLFLPQVSEEVSYLLWDTAGQEEYDSITRTYYKGAGAAVIAFSTVDRNSFDGVEKWYKKVVAECGQIVIVLVQNKIDLIEEAKMTNEEVETMAQKLQLKLYRTCVKDNLNVTEVFKHLGTEFVNRGGEIHMGVQSVPLIETMGTSVTMEKDMPHDLTTDSNAPFKLTAKKPSTQRTGGKKQKFMFMTTCSIL